MGNLLFPIEYAYLKSLFSRRSAPYPPCPPELDFNTFKDSVCQLGASYLENPELPDQEYINRNLRIHFNSGTLDDAVDMTNEIGSVLEHFHQISPRIVANASSLTVPKAAVDLGSVLVTADNPTPGYTPVSVDIAYANATQFQILRDGSYNIKARDIQFTFDDTLSDTFCDYFIKQVFTQDISVFPYDGCNIALFQGDPRRAGSLRVERVPMPSMEYVSSAFRNTSLLSIPVIPERYDWVATHLVVLGHVVDAPDWTWLICNPLPVPIVMSRGTTVEFEPGDLVIGLQ